MASYAISADATPNAMCKRWDRPNWCNYVPFYTPDCYARCIGPYK